MAGNEKAEDGLLPHETVGFGPWLSDTQCRREHRHAGSRRWSVEKRGLSIQVALLFRLAERHRPVEILEVLGAMPSEGIERPRLYQTLQRLLVGKTKIDARTVV